MNQLRSCGCKGCRTCLICENEFGIDKKSFYTEYKNLESYVLCPDCNKIYPGWDVNKTLSEHLNKHKNIIGIESPGILVKLNFISTAEGKDLMKELDNIQWQGSQSGRRKQNFGPKTNFKKRKLQNGTFNGFPKFTKFIQQRFKDIKLLDNFQTIEQCTLEYNPEKGASIDPHIDDCWIWGQRVVTVNCLGDSVLTLSKYKGDETKYNLDLVNCYQNHLICDLLDDKNFAKYDNFVIRVPMPNLSLIVLYGPARYQFEHCVLREDINERRVCLAYREFSPTYLEGGDDYDKGLIVTQNAQHFWENK